MVTSTTDTNNKYAYYRMLRQKAIVIEIVNKTSGALLRSFVFSLPPESMQISMPQRISVTKTFGGVFVDDYGNDIATINIAGSTGNTQLKEVYITDHAEYMTGKDEAYYIIDSILQYKRGLDNYDDYEIWLYDLSSIQDSGAGIAPSVFGWKAILKDGSISRSKEKPLFYNYSLSFIGIEPLGTKHYSSSTGGDYNSFLDEIALLMADITANISSLKNILSAYKSLLNYLNVVADDLATLDSDIAEYSQLIQGAISATLEAGNSVFDIINFPQTVAETVLSDAISLKSAAMDAWDTIVSNYQTSDLTGWSSTIADLTDQLLGIENDASAIVAYGKSNNAMPTALVTNFELPGSVAATVIDSTSSSSSSNTNTPTYYILLTYGAKPIIATSSTRLDALAMAAYGDPDYDDTVAAYNGIVGDSDISPGDVINIPYLAYTAALASNQVYSSNNDVLGTDISLDDTGDLEVAEYCDYVVVEGTPNMGQAVQARLKEDNGTRIRLSNYGIIRRGGGVDVFSMAILLASIQTTLLDDPRISSVSNMEITLDGTAVYISFDLQLATGGVASYTISL